MADLKISQLTAATTPLAGTEVLPIVQSSTTVKVAVSDLTAGRAISATAATLSTGNLNFSSTAQRITGDFSNATAANRLSFQTSTTNGNTIIQVFPNGTGTTSTSLLFNSTDSLNSGYAQLRANASEISFLANAVGTGTFLPMTFYTNGSERMRIDTTGRVGIGTTPSVAGVQLTVLGGGTQLSPGTTAQEGVRIQRATGYATLSGINNDNNAYNGLQFFTGASAAVTIDTSGNVGIGTASPAQIVEASLSQNGKTQVKVTNVNAGASASAGVLFGTSSGDNGYIGANGGAASSALGGANAVQVTNLTANPLVLATNATERMRITAAGNIVAGASAALATTATDGFLYVPTCAGTPTGTPTAITGMAPIVVNTTNNKLYFYSGGAWRDAGP